MDPEVFDAANAWFAWCVRCRQRNIVLDASIVIFGGGGEAVWLLRVGFVLLRIALG